MNRKILTFILTSICLLFLARPSIAIVTEYRKAVDAYKKEDYKTSYNLILPLAKKGFAQAQYNLGVMYGNGRGVAKDYSKAIKWWNLAADQGNGKAQYNLGLMHEKGKGVKKNLKKAKKWFQLASNQGLAKAQEKLNLLLIEEYYFEKTNETKEYSQENTASSKELKSLKEKNSKEINDLQITNASFRSELNQIKSEKGKTIEATNQVNAKAKQEKLASISDNPSELNTGSVSFQGDAFNGARYSADTFTKVGDDINGLDRFHGSINSLGKKEFATEHQLLLDLADKGIPEAQINLGMMFESGQGVPQDYNEAIRWYRLAADLGLIEAQEKLNLLLNKTKEHLQENTASSRKFKSLKEKSSKEINDLQIATASLHSELDQIKSEKATAIEATDQANEKAKQEQLAS